MQIDERRLRSEVWGIPNEESRGASRTEQGAVVRRKNGREFVLGDRQSSHVSSVLLSAQDCDIRSGFRYMEVSGGPEKDRFRGVVTVKTRIELKREKREFGDHVAQSRLTQKGENNHAGHGSHQKCERSATD